MSDTVITALIMAVASVVCQLLINRSNRKQRVSDEKIKEARLEDRLKGIETKLDTHNGYAEKLGNIQTDIAVIKNDVKRLYEHV